MSLGYLETYNGAAFEPVYESTVGLQVFTRRCVKAILSLWESHSDLAHYVDLSCCSLYGSENSESQRLRAPSDGGAYLRLC